MDASKSDFRLFSFKNLFLLGLICSFIACSTYNKEDYLADFEDFITEVKTEHKTYNQKSWEKKDKVYEQYSDKYYNEFYDDLEPTEVAQIKKWTIDYPLYKGKDKLGDGLARIFNGIGNAFKSEGGVELDELVKEFSDEVIDPLGSGIQDILNNKDGVLDDLKSTIEEHADDIKKAIEDEDGEWQKFKKDLNEEVLKPMLEDIQKEVEKDKKEENKNEAQEM